MFLVLGRESKMSLDININADFIYFLQWLATVKRYEALDVIRVIEKPHQVSELYQQYKEENRV